MVALGEEAWDGIHNELGRKVIRRKPRCWEHVKGSQSINTRKRGEERGHRPAPVVQGLSPRESTASNTM